MKFCAMGRTTPGSADRRVARGESVSPHASLALATIGLVVLSLAAAAPARAHPVPRLYASLSPAAAYDPLQAIGLVGAGVLVGLGDDPEHGSLIIRGDLYAAVGRVTSVGGGGGLLYRSVLWRTDSGILYTWAVGLAAVVFGTGEQLSATVGARGELSARVGDHVAFTFFVLTGPSAGPAARIPWGVPFGFALELGSP